MRTIVTFALLISIVSIVTLIAADMYSKEVTNLFEYVNIKITERKH